MNRQPFYHPQLSYEENYRQGPFGAFAAPTPYTPPQTTTRFLDFDVTFPFGIPAGPLLNARFVRAAFLQGFPLCTYKTVRSRATASLPFPNVLSVRAPSILQPDQTLQVEDAATAAFQSITNSFGVPSQDPSHWQPDMTQAVRYAGKGQLLIGSFQGSGGGAQQIRDYAITAQLVAETGAPILEANVSCPNEGHSQLVCFDVPRVRAIVQAIKQQVSDRPLFIKLAWFADEATLAELVQSVGPLVEGFCAINTIPARIVTATGDPALEGRTVSGVCGAAIRWAGLQMVQRLAHWRAHYGMDFHIIGGGGVLSVADYTTYLAHGADAVMSATGAMWNPFLAQDILQTNLS